MSEQTSPAAPPKKPRGRSPSYPAINLETALQRTRQLWEAERQYQASVETIVTHWGYRSFNGPASLALAALKKFGLIEDEGTGTARVAKVSDLAVDILENPDETARREATQRAALNPSIHRELWEKYGTELPSDTNLRWELTRQRNFTETGADEFIPQYRSTVAFAQLRSTATLPTQTVVRQEDDDDDDSETDELPSPDPRPRGRARRPSRLSTETDPHVLTIPLVGGTAVLVEGEFPITETDWNQMMAVLNAMKPGLVAEPQDESLD
ncbi:MAG: hypothetical protein M3256_08950 [Actinomycetota bacterium]|nr:hypothetical protein [Actinomycetota bacterium]